jgi:hypothetical protein
VSPSAVEAFLAERTFQCHRLRARISHEQCAVNLARPEQVQDWGSGLDRPLKPGPCQGCAGPEQGAQPVTTATPRVEARTEEDRMAARRKTCRACGRKCATLARGKCSVCYRQEYQAEKRHGVCGQTRDKACACCGADGWWTDGQGLCWRCREDAAEAAKAQPTPTLDAVESDPWPQAVEAAEPASDPEPASELSHEPQGEPEPEADFDPCSAPDPEVAGLIYVASPYTGPRKLRVQRADYAAFYCAKLMELGYQVFSPIVLGHQVSEYIHPGHDTHEDWMQRCMAWLDRCDTLMVLMIDGWDTSRGVAAEIAAAESAGKRTWFVRLKSETAEAAA